MNFNRHLKIDYFRISIEIKCMTEKLIVIIIKMDYLKVPSKSTAVLLRSIVPTTDFTPYNSESISPRILIFAPVDFGYKITTYINFHQNQRCSG